MKNKTKTDSSYRKNNYDSLFSSLVKIYKPSVCYEFGVLNGYSALSIAKALRYNKKGHLYACDLFENYEFNKSNFSDFNKKIINNKLQKYCTAEKINAFDKVKEMEDNSIDFIHFDISNDGEKLINFAKLILPKLKKSAVFIFEGGSAERDKVEWIKKYNKLPINHLFKDKFFLENYNYYTFEPFPSLTICSKR